MKKRVLVSVPTTGWVHKHVVFTLLQLFRDPRFAIRIILPTHRPFEVNLHRIIKDFMKGGEDYWLSIDSDNPPMGNPLDRVTEDKDIIGFPTPVWHYTGQDKERPIYWNVYRFNEEEDGYNEWMPREGLAQVDAIGTGCFLIARRVFEHPEMRKAPFLREYTEEGLIRRGNDLAFCERAYAHGFQVWADFTRPCRHFVELELGEVVKAFKGLGVK